MEVFDFPDERGLRRDGAQEGRVGKVGAAGEEEIRIRFGRGC